MSDDELDALDKKERDEFEARLKARRDKVASDRLARDEKVRKEAELKAKADEVLAKIGDTKNFEDFFDALVPQSGKCDTLAGELIRAVNKIEYRWFNDGDRFFEDYGIETCGPAFQFILNNIDEDSFDLFYNLFEKAALDNLDNEEYDEFVAQLRSAIVNYILSHKEVFAKETKDMLDINWRDVEENLERDGWIPTYETDSDFPDELQAHLDKGNVSERDIQWEVESWLDNMGDYNADVSVSDYVYIENMKKSSYDELNDNLYRWLEQYASDLTSEYGDPYEEDSEEEEETEEGEE